MKGFASSGNRASIDLAPGDSLYVGRHWLRSRMRDQDLRPAFWDGFLPDAFFSRLLAGRLFDPYVRSKSGSCRVELVGMDQKGSFVALEIEDHESFFVRVQFLAAYRFRPKGRFVVSRNPWDLGRWLSGTVAAVVVRGPASIILYGTDLAFAMATETYDCRSDLVAAFDANAEFSLGAEKDGGEGWLAPIMTTTSGNIYMCFEPGTRVVQTTGSAVRRGRLARAYRLIVGVLLSAYFLKPYLIEPLLRWLMAERSI